ncbi:MAG: anthranilate synthase component I [Nitrospinaceae bacterium]|nr:anthranilate synthase component I [Nitrospinaceae bacterium]NIR53303.1 anthranilate synthase component I [Nitrospinaceae bacterium]NIS83701.1 anthranilate synthase component I [Nitrospinaceae bacterium]NIT80497.1 anthranilate synthase component I [Nitrospinaceae bacterium]NIU42825.1 anthranilate synthase component I [Nitrospinaceae bacterium]
MGYKPTFEEFQESARRGNLIPVYKEILADLDTPVSAYMKIGADSYSFLLESVEGGDKWARYCFLGCGPSTIIQSKGSTVTVRTHDRQEKKETGGEIPLTVLKDILSQYQPVEMPDLPRFSGGAVGFISYDMVRYFENLPDQAEDDLQIPDSTFIITDTLLVFDNVTQTIKIVSNAHTTGRDLEEVYKETTEKIDALEKKLRQPTPNSSDGASTSSAVEELRIESNFAREQFKEAVLKAKRYILEGDAIQIVLAQRLKFDIEQDPFTIYRALRTINPSPYMYYLNFGEIQVVGSSPEVLVRLEGEQVEVRPIAGTRKRGQNEDEDQILEKDLLSDEKELAEHIMLVDLGRNDLGRVSQIHSVNVNEKFTIERYSHVMHIVSNVRGRLKEGLDCFDVLKAAFPAGTVSGAPKIRAMEIIDELEPNRRGIYAGAVGYISFSGNMDTAIAIRTLVVKDQVGYLGVGAGIVADSVPDNEFEETMNKGRAMLKAIGLAGRGLLP